MTRAGDETSANAVFVVFRAGQRLNDAARGKSPSLGRELIEADTQTPVVGSLARNVRVCTQDLLALAESEDVGEDRVLNACGTQRVAVCGPLT
jgi:hypothetical protein